MALTIDLEAGAEDRPAGMLGRAISAVLASGRPDQPVARRSDLDTVLGAQASELAGFPATARAAVTAASVRANTYAGRVNRAVELAERDARRFLMQVAGVSPAAVQSACYAALAETYILAGRLRDGAESAHSAADYAEEAEDPAARYRATELLAVSQALNGQFKDATQSVERAKDLWHQEGWATPLGWPLALAMASIASRDGDEDVLAQAVTTLSVRSSSGVVERSLAGLARGWLAMMREDYRQAVVEAAAISGSVDRQLCPEYVIDLAIALQALALVHLGEPGAALRVLAGRASAPGHAVCFEVQRAGIQLQLGEPRKVLQLTQSCVQDCPDHSLATLPSVLLRRAVAYELLGQSSAADAEFSRSSHLAQELGGVRPAVGLPLDVLERLFLRMVAKEPEFSKTVMARIPLIGEYPDRASLDFDPVDLTNRELVLAQWLVTGRTLREIAEELHVSTNTLKTQAKSLYRKLDVSSRQDAVGKLDRAGITGVRGDVRSVKQD